MELTDDEKVVMDELQLLTAKPVLFVANVSEDHAGCPEDSEHYQALAKLAAEQGAEIVAVSAAIESEVAQLPLEDRAEFLETLGPRRTGPKPSHPRQLQAARPADVFDRWAQRDPRLDDSHWCQGA